MAVIWQCRHAFRQMMARRIVRWPLLGVAIIGEAFLFYYAFSSPLPPVAAENLAVIKGFFGISLLLAVVSASVGMSTLLADPRKLWLLLLSPLSPRQSLWVVLSPAALFALFPVAYLGLPFALFLALRNPLLAVAILVTCACVLGWAFFVATTVATLLGRNLGRERAGHLLRVSSGPLAVGALFIFKTFLKVEHAGTTAFAFLVFTPLVIFPLLSRSTAAFVDMLLGAERPAVSSEPQWGRPNSWRHLWRSLSVPAMLLSLPALVAVASVPTGKNVLYGMLPQIFVHVPLERLLQAEVATPDRLRIAPRAHAFRYRLLLLWGGGPWLLVVFVCTFVTWGHWQWLTVLVCSSLLLLLTHLLEAKAVRTLIQVVLIIIPIIASTVWFK